MGQLPAERSVQAAPQKQFLINNSAQAALNAAFLPALMLSGFIYEIRSMPKLIQMVTYVIPARYFVTAMADDLSGG